MTTPRRRVLPIGHLRSVHPAHDRFLRTDRRDVGSAEAMEMLHIYAELAAAGEQAEQRYPGIAAHLR